MCIKRDFPQPFPLHLGITAPDIAEKGSYRKLFWYTFCIVLQAMAAVNGTSQVVYIQPYKLMPRVHAVQPAHAPQGGGRLHPRRPQAGF